MRLIGVLLVIAGCGNPDVPITPDGHPLPDGPPRVGGLTVTWNADPALPGEVDDKITVTEATFQIEYLQVESDLGLAERTTRSKFQLRWTSGVAPEPDTFREAPAATYQSVLIGIRPAPGQPAYEIKGNWQDDEAGSGAGAGGMMRPFRITDGQPQGRVRQPRLQERATGRWRAGRRRRAGAGGGAQPDREAVRPRERQLTVTRARPGPRTWCSSSGGMRRAWPHRRSRGA
ncbi:MAG: hypothetical protein E6J91_02365 [Deltaproteobacteria bacterium]|nr:MAG: hypothetical protein E6J91_02365 [Deltaproteobacteria bacterium]